jgi:ketosteroid isomerase-like protein
MDNQNLIRHFYESFARGDADAMAACYHDEVEFSDPAFGTLQGSDAGKMWKMLVGRAKGNLKISFSNVVADDQKGSADWVADYPFSKTGRQVHNEIHAEFEFRDGKIFRHRDTFDFWKWSKQALGPLGAVLGWSSFLKNKIRKTALESLHEFKG